MEYWWKENKRFAVTVGGGLLGVFVWYLFVIGSINASADKATRDLKNARMVLQSRLAQGIPADDSVGRADRDRKALTDDLKELQAATEFKVEAPFKYSEGAGKPPLQQLGGARNELAGLVNTWCKQKRFPQIPSTLGMPNKFDDLSDAIAIEWLKRLAMIRQICFLATQHGERLELVETVPGQLQDESLINDKRFLNKLSMKIRLTASEEGLIRFLHALQTKGSYLAVEGFATQPIDLSRSSLQVELVLSGIFTNLGEEIAPPEKRE